MIALLTASVVVLAVAAVGLRFYLRDPGRQALRLQQAARVEIDLYRLRRALDRSLFRRDVHRDARRLSRDLDRTLHADDTPEDAA